MKKIITLIIILAGIFIVSSLSGCVYNDVFYCPYCSYGSVEKLEGDDGFYFKCTNSNCGKIFGAKEIE